MGGYRGPVAALGRPSVNVPYRTHGDGFARLVHADAAGEPIRVADEPFLDVPGEGVEADRRLAGTGDLHCGQQLRGRLPGPGQPGGQLGVQFGHDLVGRPVGPVPHGSQFPQLPDEQGALEVGEGGALGFEERLDVIPILLNGLSVMRFHRVAPDPLEHIPLWTDLDLWPQRMGRRLFNNPGWVRNPVLYFLFPGAVLLLCRVRPAELGLRRGYRSWVAAAPYLLFAGVATAVHIAMGDTRVYTVLPRTLLSHFLQNGFTEEFLFRGALQTRLAQLIGDGWSLVVSSLVFGAVHWGSTTRMTGGDYLAGLAVTVVLQACSGLVFGLMFMRTRSLIAPTVAHITLNMIG